MVQEKKQAIIVGAGPAGLTAAYELLKRSDIHPVIYEESNDIGGISKTVEHNGNRIDIGGHRFFSKNDTVMQWWQEVMPIQGKASKDDLLVPAEKELVEGGPDPEAVNRVMLIRRRISRIFYLRNFFEYPISLKAETFRNMGFIRTMKAGFGYMWSVVFKRKENSLEDFYINRFGKPLYKMFFEDYTEKVWGVHPSGLGADWGAQRVKGLSLSSVLIHIVKKMVSSKQTIEQKDAETSLIEQFIYPKLGPGQLWETVASDIKEKGGNVYTNCKVTGIRVENNRVICVETEENGTIQTKPCDYLFSSMPIKDLVAAIKGIEAPGEVREIAEELPYRDFITVGLLVDKLKIKNKTKIKTYKERAPDTWIYIQERDVKIGRLQLFNNWSPYMVNDYENKMWIGLEYFCTEGDGMWNMPPDEFIQMAIDELVKIDIVERPDICDSVQLKVKKAYPSYYGSYYQLDKVIAFLSQIENLYCIGRNGQHRYNNMDHSMLTAMTAVDCILANKSDKSVIWEVNTEEEYHESKNK
ncbi:MAG: NAD(P)/FAD-dependent oxidoreductase [Tannerellaceae bacterium]|jgi:protoporphyrinogen oxidase|nr:NAD(P)/FAD-dependent oxidoreductase [Tannerellaceae bacterium]